MARTETEISADIACVEESIYHLSNAIGAIRRDLRDKERDLSARRAKLGELRDELQAEEDRRNEVETLRNRVKELEDALHAAGLPA